VSDEAGRTGESGTGGRPRRLVGRALRVLGLWFGWMMLLGVVIGRPLQGAVGDEYALHILVVAFVLSGLLAAVGAVLSERWRGSA
jgi:hypothetical protein